MTANIDRRRVEKLAKLTDDPAALDALSRICERRGEIPPQVQFVPASRDDSDSVMVEREIRSSVWIGCVSAYCAGTLHGEWVEVPEEAEDLDAHIARILSTSPCENAETWAFFDYNNCPNLGENASVDEVIACANVVSERGEAFVSILRARFGDDWIKYADSSYSVYESEGDYARETHEESVAAMPFSSYIDWAAVERDMDFNGEIFREYVDGYVWVFFAE